MFLRKAWAFFKRDLLESMSYKTQWALDAASIIAQTFVFFYVAKLLSGQVIPSLQHYQGGYFSFVLIGIALAGFQAAALESFAKAIYREQGSGTLEAVLLSPTSLQSVVLYSLFWTTLFIFLRLIFFLTLGFVFFNAEFGKINFLSAALVLFLTLASLSGLGLVSAALILVLKRADPLGYVLNGLSRLISGVYFPLAVLPAWIQSLSLALPLTYSLHAMRKAVLENAGVTDIAPELGALLGFTLVLAPLGWFCFGKALEKSRRDGTLTFV